MQFYSSFRTQCSHIDLCYKTVSANIGSTWRTHHHCLVVCTWIQHSYPSFISFPHVSYAPVFLKQSLYSSCNPGMTLTFSFLDVVLSSSPWEACFWDPTLGIIHGDFFCGGVAFSFIIPGWELSRVALSKASYCRWSLRIFLSNDSVESRLGIIKIVDVVIYIALEWCIDVFSLNNILHRNASNPHPYL